MNEVNWIDVRPIFPVSVGDLNYPSSVRKSLGNMQARSLRVAVSVTANGARASSPPSGSPFLKACASAAGTPAFKRRTKLTEEGRVKVMPFLRAVRDAPSREARACTARKAEGGVKRRSTKLVQRSKWASEHQDSGERSRCLRNERSAEQHQASAKGCVRRRVAFARTRRHYRLDA